MFSAEDILAELAAATGRGREWFDHNAFRILRRRKRLSGWPAVRADPRRHARAMERQRAWRKQVKDEGADRLETVRRTRRAGAKKHWRKLAGNPARLAKRNAYKRAWRERLRAQGRRVT